MISNKSKFLESDVPQNEIVFGLDNLNNVIFTASASGVKYTIVVYTIRTEKDTFLQKAETPRHHHLRVMMSYLQARNLTGFNLGLGQGEK